jgi:hypothetical protein
MTFGRLGRAFLLAAAGLAVAALLSLLVVDELLVPLILGGLALLGVVQGIVWTTIQHRMFGSFAALRRAAAQPRTTATVLAAHSTSSAIGADAIAKLDLLVDGQKITRHVRVPFNYAATIRAGLELPVRTDPAGSRALIVEWNRLS